MFILGFFSVRVRICVEGVDISDSEDEDESKCNFPCFKLNVWSKSVIVHLVRFVMSYSCAEKQVLNFFSLDLSRNFDQCHKALQLITRYVPS